jgi:thymidylate synthase
MQKLINIEATTLDDAWFQLIWNILEYGRDFKINQGSYAGSTRKELDFCLIHIRRPFERDSDGFPLIPKVPEGSNMVAPVEIDYLSTYAPYILGSEVAEDESYTYGQRMNKEPVSREIAEGVRSNWKIYRKYIGSKQLESIVFDSDKFLSQVELAIEVYKEHPRTNQMCLQIAKPTDMLLIDPPCLRLIDTRIQDGKLHFYIYFRSWDAWGGFPANLAGISMLQEHMADEIGVEEGEIICFSKGLHIYNYAVSFAQMRCMVDGECK